MHHARAPAIEMILVLMRAQTSISFHPSIHPSTHSISFHFDDWFGG